MTVNWVILALLGVGAYEMVRGWIVRAVQNTLTRRARRFVESRDVRLDRFKLGTETWVREELMNDLAIAEAILARSRETGRKPEDLRREVEQWIDEIVPRFSLASYYQFGSRAARLGINALYTPVIDAESARAARRAPKDASVIYLMNHRSNADYVLVAYFLLESVSVSYAVGEWARVWPLDALFKSFGGYFVRRGFKEPLYHKVLERYVQLTTRVGVTQGIFPEGKLTRDGKLNAPKIGLLEAMVKLCDEPGFTRDVVLVPVGLNFDRVLEDRTLVSEAKAKEARPPSLAQKTVSALWIFLTAPFVLAANVLRALTGRLKRLGYASARFGTPYSVRERIARLPGGKLPADPEARRAFVKSMAEEVMGEIGRLVPATPVPLVARALCALAEKPAPVPGFFAVRDVEVAVGQAMREVARGGGRVVLGHEFRLISESRAALEETAEERNKEMLELDRSIVESAEAEQLTRLGLEMLRRRLLVRRRKGQVTVAPEAWDLLRYYANSLAAFEVTPSASRSTQASS